MAKKCPELVHVEIRSDGVTSSVLIDGVDYSMKATSITFRHEGGHTPVVLIEMPVGSIHVVGSVAELRILGGPEKGTV